MLDAYLAYNMNSSIICNLFRVTDEKRLFKC